MRSKRNAIPNSSILGQSTDLSAALKLTGFGCFCFLLVLIIGEVGGEVTFLPHEMPLSWRKILREVTR